MLACENKNDFSGKIEFIGLLGMRFVPRISASIIILKALEAYLVHCSDEASCKHRQYETGHELQQESIEPKVELEKALLVLVLKTQLLSIIHVKDFIQLYYLNIIHFEGCANTRSFFPQFFSCDMELEKVWNCQEDRNNCVIIFY